MTEMAEACRALARPGSAALATLGAGNLGGTPYVSLVLVAWDERFRPILLISSLAEHTKNIDADGRASLLMTDDGADPLARPRMTVIGRFAALTGDEAESARTRFVHSHPSAAGYATFRDFRVYRLEVETIRLVAGFGRQAWITAKELLEAAPSSPKAR
jgi:putative heme iron utilization protein